ncbi:hypothetical protein Z947_1647 [Sulfitobacter geojensis]|nr:hypothetical protein Z947_1647 [Sulfitobacter geojensis]
METGPLHIGGRDRSSSVLYSEELAITTQISLRHEAGESFLVLFMF